MVFKTAHELYILETIHFKTFAHGLIRKLHAEQKVTNPKPSQDVFITHFQYSSWVLFYSKLFHLIIDN